jgi:hypothetical protein
MRESHARIAIQTSRLTSSLQLQSTRERLDGFRDRLAAILERGPWRSLGYYRIQLLVAVCSSQGIENGT